MEKRIIHGENKSNFDRPIAVYARQSVEKENSISIEQQIDYCLTMCKNQGYAGPVFVYADEGFSGKNINRPDFKRLLSDVVDDKLSCIFTYKLDRMSRKLLDYLNLKEDFKAHNVEIHSYSEPELNKNDDLVTNILMAFAEQERKNTAARVRDNYFSRTKKRGSWPGGKPPFGFSLGKKDGIPTLIPIAEEIEIVKEIFNIYHDTAGISLGQLAKIIEEKGIKGKNGSTFTSVTVGRILRNPIYVKADILLYDYLYKVYFPHGNENETNEDYNFMSPKEKWDGTHSAMIINKRPSSHNTVRTYTDYKERRAFLTNIEGIIESKTFVEVQEKLAKNKQLRRSNKIGVLQELTGLIKCGHCGLAVKSFSKRVVLTCYGRVALHKCDVKFAEMGKTCPEAFEDLRIKIGLCITKYYLHLINAYKEIDEQNKKTEALIDKKRNEIDVLVETMVMLEAEGRSRAQKRINELSREISELRYELSYSTQTNNLIQAKQNLNYFALSTEEKKEILNLLIDKILLYPDYSFEIIWKNKALSQVEDGYPIEYFNNGKIRLKEDKVADMSEKEFNDLIYEAVGIKVEGAKNTCQLKNIDIPKGFFDVYENKKDFLRRFDYFKKIFSDAKQEQYNFAEDYGCPPASDEDIVAPSDMDTSLSKEKLKTLFFEQRGFDDILRFFDVHKKNKLVPKEHRTPFDEELLNVSMLRQFVFEKATPDLISNELLTLAFTLLLPFDENKQYTEKSKKKHKIYRFDEYSEIYRILMS